MSSHTLAPPLRVVSPSSSAQEPAEVRALAGQQGAWNELARAHNRKVVLVLLSRGLQPDVARDVAQDVWARLIEQQRQGRLSAIKMPGLAIKQALYLASDLARRNNVQVQPSDKDEGHDPFPRLWARAGLARARQRLKSCTATERSIFEALYTSPAASIEEIASRLGISIQRVRQIHCELRKKLRDAVAGSHDE